MNEPPKCFGFRNHLGEEIHFHRRSELIERDDLQSFLERAHDANPRLTCLCCAGQPPVFVYFHPTLKKFLTRRGSVLTFHPPGCPSITRWVAQERAETGPLYTAAIWDRPPLATVAATAASLHQDSEQPNQEYGDFTGCCNRVFSQAALAAFTRANPNFPARNPTANEFLAAVRATLDDLRHTNGQNVWEVLTASGRQCSFGFTSEPLAEKLLCAPLRPLQLVRFPSDDGVPIVDRPLPRIWFDRVIADNLAGRYRTRNGFIAPPYFFLCAHGPRTGALAARLYLQPVAEISAPVYPVDSELERECARYLLRSGKIFVKPKHPRELACALQLPLEWFTKNGTMPDFVVFYDGLLVLIECAGFEDPDYLEKLAKKQAFYNQLRDKGVRHLTVARAGHNGSKLMYQDLRVGSQVLRSAPVDDWPLERIFPGFGSSVIKL